ncbi:MAG: HAD family phosphatase [Planctomycetaceae bacterium]|jgi:beta-phosphoglucomutase-like phosphatase (HAD superfamily)|nr:HAD family phosphatase [Planctomycetaceae bacterium]
MKKIIEAVAFDMDGLMFDTEAVYWKSAAALLGRRGYEYTEELCNAIMGRPPRDCFELFKKTFSLPESWQELQRESEDFFLGFLGEGFSAMPGLFELLDFLELQDVPKCICTSSSLRVVTAVLQSSCFKIPEAENAIATSQSGCSSGCSGAKPTVSAHVSVGVSSFDFAGRFKFVLTAEDVVQGKPNPEIYLRAAEKMGVQLSKLLVLEDSVAGCLAADAAGAFPVIVLAEHNKNGNFQKAKLIANSLNDPKIKSCIAPTNFHN